MDQRQVEKSQVHETEITASKLKTKFWTHTAVNISFDKIKYFHPPANVLRCFSEVTKQFAGFHVNYCGIVLCVGHNKRIGCATASKRLHVVRNCRVSLMQFCN